MRIRMHAARPFLTRRLAAFVACGLVASAAGIGIATAAIPDGSTDLISACLRTNGAIRIVDKPKAKRCAKGERLLEWPSATIRYRGLWSNAVAYREDDLVTHNGSAFLARRTNRGVPPAAGATWGVIATAGSPGLRGPAGQPGLQGPAGVQGPVGPQGAIGPPGNQGANGAQGRQGIAGPVGPQGAPGPIGPKGDVGATGQVGPIGPSGPPGLPAPVPLQGFGSLPPEPLPASGTSSFRMVTAGFTAPASASCLVTSTIQAQPSVNAPNDTAYLVNAVSRDGVTQHDGGYGQFLYNGPGGRTQPSMTRSTVLTVNAGQVVQFGVFIGGLTTGWYGAAYAVTTSYSCS